jgi:DNA-binding MarR family transcriptional regulator
MAAMSSPAPQSASDEPSLADYRSLAEFRYQIRRFLSFSEHAARAAGMEPQQHQLLLAIKGLPPDRRPTIKALAERLCVQHHTVVALVDQVEARKLVRRKRHAKDRREILLVLTAQGDRILRGLSVLHRDQLRVVGPTLVEALASILGQQQKQAQSPRSPPVPQTTPAA